METQSPTSTEKMRISTKEMALTGLMAAMICLLAPLSLPIFEIPVTLGFLAIYFVVSVLGMKLGTLSVLIYILLGLAGLPVFSKFRGGPDVLFGPTGGYIIGYLFMAPICGYFVDRWNGKVLLRFLGMVLGSIVCYLFGTVWYWLTNAADKSFLYGLSVCVLPYVPFDLAKLVIAMVTGGQLRSRLVKAGLINGK